MLAAGLGAVRPGTANAQSSGKLLPVAQGAYSAWSPSAGTSEVAAVDDGTCGVGDGQWITGPYLQYSSYRLDMSSIPSNVVPTSVDLTVCYSDDDSNNLLQAITPMIRWQVSNVYGHGDPKDDLGTPLDPMGSTNIVQATQHFTLAESSQYVLAPGDFIEVGVRDSGFFGRVRVYALWAVVNYDWQPLTVTLSNLTVSETGGHAPPYSPGMIVKVLFSVEVQGTGYTAESYFVFADWDPTLAVLKSLEPGSWYETIPGGTTHQFGRIFPDGAYEGGNYKGAYTFAILVSPTSLADCSFPFLVRLLSGGSSQLVSSESVSIPVAACSPTVTPTSSAPTATATPIPTGSAPAPQATVSTPTAATPTLTKSATTTPTPVTGTPTVPARNNDPSGGGTFHIVAIGVTSNSGH